MKQTFLLRNFRRNLDETDAEITARLSEQLHLEPEAFSWSVWRESLDARRSKPFFELQLRLDIKAELTAKAKKMLVPLVEPEILKLKAPPADLVRPVIVGFGPAGLFAAYALAQYGYRPIVLERGADVGVRAEAVAHFWRTGKLNLQSNVAFGEGGAGTFSDGKLVSRSKDTLSHTVFEILVKHGAPANICYSQKPHIGTDLLVGIIASMRQQIIEWGGEIHFNSKVDKLLFDRGVLKGVSTDTQDVFATSRVIMAIGHSSRDTMRYLATLGGEIESKPFAVGFRIEHCQNAINRSLYHAYYNHPRLGAASYALKGEAGKNDNNKVLQHQVYTFCMCPGGVVVNASSEEGELVVNGMSDAARSGSQANSAIVCQVDSRDYGTSLFAGLEFQKQLEQRAYALGGGGFGVPCQRVDDFLADRITTEWGRVLPTVLPHTVMTNLRGLLPHALEQQIVKALPYMHQKMEGFARPDDVLSAVETRTSSPLRFVRNPATMMWNSVDGVMPLGEGAGYAGGITSAAIDGLRGAIALAQSYT